LSETLSRDTIEKPRLIPKPLIWLNYLCIYISSLTLYLLSNAKSRSCEVAMYFLSQYHQFKNFQMRFDCFLIDKYGRFKYIENAWEVNGEQLMGVL
uniref:hypothetical protein n=1 Tax=Candidatus Bandiella numerosa TaxID=2570586 RepID=UPI001F15C7A5